MKKIASLLLAGLLILSIAVIPISAAGRSVGITIANFRVNLNGQEMDNTYAAYPLIVYNQITYFPMTYYDCRFMGVTTDWNQSTQTLKIDATGVNEAYHATTQVTHNPSSAVATVADYTVVINGKAINNATEQYPLLNFRDVTYFPMTWRFCVDEFGWDYSYTNEAGLTIQSQGLLQISDIETTLTVGIPYGLQYLDPNQDPTVETERIANNVFEGLAKCGENGSLEPCLAESWSFDGKTYKFVIRKGVTFHDGSTLSAEDVVYSFRRLSGMIPEDQSAVRYQFSDNFDSIEKTGDYEVTVSLSGTTYYYDTVYLLANIVKRQSNPSNDQILIGTGPYKITSFEPGISCTLEKYDDYWGTKANIDTVNIKVCSDLYNALQKREIQMTEMDYANSDLIPKSYKVLSIPSGVPILVELNCKEGVFSDVRVRRALNYATNQQEIIDNLCPGSEKVSSFLTKLQSFYRKDNTELYPYNPEKANKLLEEAGYTADSKCKFDMMWFPALSNGFNYYETLSLLLKAQWDRTNFDCTLIETSWDTYLSTVHSNPERKYDAALRPRGASINGNDNNIYESFRLLQSDNPLNAMMFINKEYDDLLKKALNTSNDEIKQKMYYRMQDIIAEEAVGVWLHDKNTFIILDNNYTGYNPYIIPFWDFTKIKKVN